jgi:hypothetical protein
MPILDLPRSFRRLGKIRLGEQVPVMEGGKQKVGRTGNPVTRPAKLERFRLTSPDKDLLDHAAEVYGGEVRQWAGAPGDGDQWELYVTSAALSIIVPPQHASDTGDLESGSFQQWYEMWSAGGCARRCDGVIEHISGKACTAMSPACPVDHEVRRAEAANGKACKMTTRIMLLLPELPDLGVWMLESHGWYAAVELGGFMEFLARRAPGEFVNGALVPEARQVKRGGKTHNFVVPVIKLPQATAGELLAAPSTGRELGTGSGVVSDAERVRSFVIKVSDAGWDDDVRHAIVSYATKGRTSSSREVAPDEWPACEAVLRWLTEGKLVIDEAVDTVYLRKPTDSERASAPSATPPSGPIAVQSREASAGEAEDSDAADEWDRVALANRIAKLDDEHRAFAMERIAAEGLLTPDEPELTRADVEATNRLIFSVEEASDGTYAARRKTVEAKMKEVGVSKLDARNQLASSATDGRTESLKRLTSADVDAILAYCQAMLDADAEAEKAS